MSAPKSVGDVARLFSDSEIDGVLGRSLRDIPWATPWSATSGELVQLPLSALRFPRRLERTLAEWGRGL